MYQDSFKADILYLYQDSKPDYLHQASEGMFSTPPVDRRMNEKLLEMDRARGVHFAQSPGVNYIAIPKINLLLENFLFFSPMYDMLQIYNK